MPEQKDNIYRSIKEDDTKTPQDDGYELKKAEARTRTIRTATSFIILMVSVLIAALIMAYAPEEEEEQVDEDIYSKPVATNITTLKEAGQIPVTGDFLLQEPLEELIHSASTTTRTMDPQKIAEAMGNMRMAERYLHAHDWDQAESFTRKALGIWPDMNAALRMLGVIYTQRGQFDQAVMALEAALQSDPFNAETFNNLATAYMHRGNFDKAEDLLLSSIQIDPAYKAGYLNLGLMYLASGSYGAAADYLEQSTRDFPNDMNIHNNLAVSLLRLGKYDDARRHLQYIVDHQPETASAYFNMAITYVLESNLDDALNWVHRGAQYCSPVTLTRFLSDSDFDAIREDPEFISIVRDMYPELPTAPLPSANP